MFEWIDELLQWSNCGDEYIELATGGNSVFKRDLAVHNMTSGAGPCSCFPHKEGSLCQEADNTLLIPPHCSSGSWSWYNAENSKVIWNWEVKIQILYSSYRVFIWIELFTPHRKLKRDLTWNNRKRNLLNCTPWSTNHNLSNLMKWNWIYI